MGDYILLTFGMNKQPYTYSWLASESDKVYQLLAHDWWFSPDTPASSSTKTGRHDIAGILLKVALNTINQSINMCLIAASVFSNVYFQNILYSTYCP